MEPTQTTKAQKPIIEKAIAINQSQASSSIPVFIFNLCKIPIFGFLWIAGFFFASRLARREEETCPYFLGGFLVLGVFVPQAMFCSFCLRV